ncbi:MAG: molybdate ABC transporter substrate-binding protein, partial [Myxococcota bacterium]|nr:molybdate ABC transporter substrate-binding protein [Myxococcota bacterium]
MRRLVLAGLLCGCSATSSGPDLRILTASSLGEVFASLASVFASTRPGVDVELVTAGSQTLAVQLRYGIEADVLASADVETTTRLAADGLVERGTPFATGQLVLAVSEQAASGLGLANLDTARRIVLGAPDAPVGRYADALLTDAASRFGPDWRRAVEARVVSREPDARKVAAKISLGEADAALVYATTVQDLPGIQTVSLPAALGPTPVYVQATVV